MNPRKLNYDRENVIDCLGNFIDAMAEAMGYTVSNESVEPDPEEAIELLCQMLDAINRDSNYSDAVFFGIYGTDEMKTMLHNHLAVLFEHEAFQP